MYEIFVVAVARSDKRPPSFNKVVGSSAAYREIGTHAVIFYTAKEASEHADKLNTQMGVTSYKAYRCEVTDLGDSL